MDEDLDAREAERIRRRDRDASAEERDLLRPGMGKEPPKRRHKASG